MNVIGCLKETQKLIEDEGWIQGEFHKEGVGYCLEGAMRKACTFDIDKSNSTPFLEVRRVVGKTLMVNGYRYGPINWNDEPYRTKEEVISLIQKTIYRAQVVELIIGVSGND